MLPFCPSTLLLFLVALPSGDTGRDLVAAARAQIGVTVRYNSGYQRMPFPGGDVPMDRGVCTDVVIRAYRKLGIDLQLLVHQDMVKAWAFYPRSWGLKAPDANIDHRGVPNLVVFFARHGQSFPTAAQPQAFRPGDLVTWRLPSGVPHIGLVADQRSKAGIPLIIHNIGYGTQLEDRLFDFVITGHYRYPTRP